MTFSVTALPVGQGDAFLLRVNEWTALIDGGKSMELLPRHLKDEGVTRLNVVICTHNDADHANGLIGLLKHIDWRSRIDEIWLPGVLLHALASIVAPTWEDAEELFNECSKVERSVGTLESLRLLEEAAEHREQVPTRDGTSTTAVDQRSERLERDRIESILADAPELSRAEYDARFRGYTWWYRHRRAEQTNERLFESVIEAAWRVRQLAVLARENDIRIRWFDHDEFKDRGHASGGEPHLRPLNSVEARFVIPTRPLELFKVLRLSVENRRSLVFESRSQDGAGVLFCADSDLAACDQPKVKDNWVITVPHHGAETNRQAYSTVAQWGLGSTRWLRSDGRYVGRPGPTYLKLTDPKHCTRCRTQEASGIAFSDSSVVRLRFVGGGWQSRTATCCCA